MTVATPVSPVDQRHLAEEAAGSDRADLVAIDGRHRVAVDDDEELVARLALAGHRLPGVGRDRSGQGRDVAELVVGAVAEQPDRAEQLHALVEVGTEAHQFTRQTVVSPSVRRSRARRRRVPTTSTHPMMIAANAAST